MIADSPSPELRLLLAVARVEMTETDRREALDAIERGVEWDRVVELVEHHGCTPLLHKHMATGAVPPQAVPGAVRHRVRRRANTIAKRSLRMTAELAAIVRDLESRGIGVMPMKGPVVGQTVYGSVALRRSLDLDVLCRRDQVKEALAALAALGYESDQAPVNRRVDTLHTSHHLMLSSKPARTQLELHFRLCSPFFSAPVELRSIEHRLRRTVVGDTEVSAFCPEDLLVYLCIHGTGHAWHRLEWLCAVAELIRSGEVRDWTRVTQWADELRARRLVAIGIWLASAMLGAPMPVDAPRADRRALAFARGIVARFAAELTPNQRPLDLARAALQTDASMRERLRNAWDACMVPRANDFLALPLPDSLWPVYYVIRPVRLSARFLGMLLPRASGNRPSVSALEPPSSA